MFSIGLVSIDQFFDNQWKKARTKIYEDRLRSSKDYGVYVCTEGSIIWSAFSRYLTFLSFRSRSFLVSEDDMESNIPENNTYS